jgi:hypothetical protein
MSTRVGTLQAPRAGGSILLATFLASLVMLTVAVVAISVDQGRQGQTTFVGRQLVNTPSELNAGVVGGAEQAFGGTANTPSELNAGIGWSSPPGSLHKFISDKLVTSRVIGDGLPASFYDRHQRR